jgi:hypothetical protein
MQRTIVLDYNGQKVVSKPFSFKHACIIDDKRYEAGKEGNKPTDSDLNIWAFSALQKMYEGTIVTDDILDNEINIKEVRNACNKLLDWYFGIDEETKNSSSPQAEPRPEVGG